MGIQEVEKVKLWRISLHVLVYQLGCFQDSLNVQQSGWAKQPGHSTAQPIQWRLQMCDNMYQGTTMTNSNSQRNQGNYIVKSRQLHCEEEMFFFFFWIIGQEWHFDPVWPLTDSKPQNLSTPLHQQLASGQQPQCSVTIDYWRKCLKLLYRGQTREWMNRILCLVL